MSISFPDRESIAGRGAKGIGASGTEAESSANPRVMLMGLRGSGKSSIHNVVFRKLAPNETLFLDSTERLLFDTFHSFIDFRIWDFPGQIDLSDATTYDLEVVFGTEKEPVIGATGQADLSVDRIEDSDIPRNDSISKGKDLFSFFSKSKSASSSAVSVVPNEPETANGYSQTQNVRRRREGESAPRSVVFVIDAMDDYLAALQTLHVTITVAFRYNPDVMFEVFIHKADGLSEETRIEIQRDIQTRVMDELLDHGLQDRVSISYYQTSIYDHSILEAFSKVVQKLIPQLSFLETLLDALCTSSNIEKVFLFDLFSKLYLATDSSAVDMTTYEVCSDMIDVITDLEGIYGTGQLEGPNGSLVKSEGECEQTSGSVIKLSNGLMLYLHPLNRGMALVSLLRSNVFEGKKGFMEYNFKCFADSLKLVMAKPGDCMDNPFSSTYETQSPSMP